MAKPTAERSREYRARKRAQARKLGFCAQCYKARPDAGRTICATCRRSISARITRKRKERNETLKLQQAVTMSERAGDLAMSYHLYPDAVSYYQNALDVSGLALADRERIIEKLGRTFFLTGNFSAADLCSEQLMLMRHSDQYDPVKSIDSLFQMSRQLLWECKGAAAFEILQRAVQVAEVSGDQRLIRLTKLRRVENLQMSGQYDEATKVLADLGDLASEVDPALRSNYFLARAQVASLFGNAEKSYEAFESALELIKADSDPHRVVIVWMRYGIAARELGDTARAKACYEQALFVAQQWRILWMVVHLQLLYIELLGRMGLYSVARTYLREALSPESPILLHDVLRAVVIIPLALELQDEEVLARCANPKTIELAFESQAGVASGIAHAFARLYASQGRTRAARALLHRALEKISGAHHNLDVLVAISQYGSMEDVPQARKLLEVRTALPHAAGFSAGLALFDAFVEQRQGRLAQSRDLAVEAARRFEAIQWQGYAELALSIVSDIGDRARRKDVESAPFLHMRAVLTSREREIAELVLRGYTNRDIASELRIALHTVEKHMHSIMSRLGVRSRYQVADLLGAQE